MVQLAPDGELLIGYYNTLGPNAKKMLTHFAQRLVMGKQQYGADFNEDRNWLQEALEESLDMNAYLLRAVMR